MKRDITRQIRWNEHEIELIEKVRGHQDFSDFVRNAAMEKAIEYESENGKE